MSVNGINNATTAYQSKNTAKTELVKGKRDKDVNKENLNQEAAVYEKEDKDTSKAYKTDRPTVDRMIAEAEKRAQKLRDLVEKMLLKQGETFHDATDIYALLREGKLKVDPEIKAQAQKDIAEDGYWGIQQTSDRLVSFAKALTGGDPSKADEMIAAVKKGFESATKAWGGELPEISKKTLEATIGKLEVWKSEIKNDEGMGEAADKAFRNQAITNSKARLQNNA